MSRVMNARVGLTEPPSCSRRRSVSIAALSAGSGTPSSFATCPHRIARRLDFRETGHFVQASTKPIFLRWTLLRRPLMAGRSI